MNHVMTSGHTPSPKIAGAWCKHPATASEHLWFLVVFLRTMMLVIGAALLMACTPLDESAPDCLPEPTPRRVDPPAYTPEQQVKKDEVDQFLCDRYQAEGWQIRETTQTYGGDIIDWLDPASVPGSQVEPPPPIPASEYEPLDAELHVRELDPFPELALTLPSSVCDAGV